MDFVSTCSPSWCVEHDIAVYAPHHTKKGTLAPGAADNGRGGGIHLDAARLVATLATRERR